MNTKNLETVAAYLESGDLKAAFNMQDFAGDSTDSYGSSCAIEVRHRAKHSPSLPHGFLPILNKHELL